MLCVMFFRLVRRDRIHTHGYDLKSSLLDPLDYLADQTALHAIRLYHHVGALGIQAAVPLALRPASVHLTWRGILPRAKFLWHFDEQK